MKVGTDGVLLGAWVNVERSNRILDVGAGTGLIALMLAQRSEAQIVSIEIEKNAALEAEQNVKDSPWQKRVEVHNISFQEYADANKELFDLIVSNPPFFENSLPNRLYEKSLARHNHALPSRDFLRGTKRILRNDGTLAVILPVIPANDFIELAKEYDLYLKRITEVKPRENREANRCLMEFSNSKIGTVKNTLCIFEDNETGFSDEYRKLTGDFYLAF